MPLVVSTHGRFFSDHCVEQCVVCLGSRRPLPAVPSFWKQLRFWSRRFQEQKKSDVCSQRPKKYWLTWDRQKSDPLFIITNFGKHTEFVRSFLRNCTDFLAAQFDDSKFLRHGISSPPVKKIGLQSMHTGWRMHTGHGYCRAAVNSSGRPMCCV